MRKVTTKMDAKIDPCKVITGRFRLSYPVLFKPENFKDDPEDKAPSYRISMLIDKSEDLTSLKAAAAAALEKGIKKFPDWKGKKPRDLKSPFLDGDGDDGDEVSAGCWIVRARTGADKHKPGIVNRNRVAITDPEEIYAGCYCRASLRATPYNKGNKGISFILLNVQKLEDGEPLGFATASPEDEFDDDWSTAPDGSEDFGGPPRSAPPSAKKSPPADDDEANPWDL